MHQKRLESKRTTRRIPQLTALGAVLVVFAVSNSGATDFISARSGSWFNPTNTWSPPLGPGSGDNVTVHHFVSFDSTNVSQSITVGNLDLSGGKLDLGGPAAFGMAGTGSVWSGGDLGGSGSLLQSGTLTLSATNTIGYLDNQNVVQQNGISALAIEYNYHFDNLGSGLYDLQGDGNIIRGGLNGPDPYFNNYGLLRKSSGGGNSTVSVPFNNLSGAIEVDSGTLILGDGGTSSNGTFTVSAGAVLDLTGGSTPTWAGVVTGSGAGQVRLSSGTLNGYPSVSLNLSPGLFQWAGGALGGTVHNANVVTIAGACTVSRGGVLHNAGFFRHTNSVTLGVTGDSYFENLAGGTYDLEGDGGLVNATYGGADPYFNNYGLLHKSSGGGNSTVSVLFNNLSGAIEVDSGKLVLGDGGTSSNGTFTVSAGAVLDLTGGSTPTWAGVVTGSGAGQVQLSSGTLIGSPSVSLNLSPGLFQWAGGALGGTVHNVNVVTIAGGCTVSRGGVLHNAGFFRHTNSVTLGVTGDSHFENLAGGTYDLEGDGGVINASSGGAEPYFSNYGLLRKSTGTGTSAITVLLRNLGGSIRVDSGTMSLGGSGTSSNGTFTVAAGAVLDLTGGSSPTWAGQVTGSGAGQLLLSGGVLTADPNLTLNIVPGLFQWTGGWLSGTTINSNAMTIAGSVTLSGVLYNNGRLDHINSGTLGIRAGSHLENQAGGIYDLMGDGAIAYGGGGGLDPYFNNYGLLRKSGGSGTSTISTFFYNQNGSIEVDSGTLTFGLGSYSQGTGALIVKLGGRGVGQTGRLSVSGGAALSGPLNVGLSNGFAPAPGDQFQILSSGGLSGAFTTLNVPPGIAVTYSNNDVFLVVTSAVPAQILSPQMVGGNFAFSVGTVTNQSYTVQQNTNLATTNWSFYTNFIGNGSIIQIVAPVTNTPKRFFRVREP